MWLDTDCFILYSRGDNISFGGILLHPCEFWILDDLGNEFHFYSVGRSRISTRSYLSPWTDFTR